MLYNIDFKLLKNHIRMLAVVNLKVKSKFAAFFKI